MNNGFEVADVIDARPIYLPCVKLGVRRSDSRGTTRGIKLPDVQVMQRMASHLPFTPNTGSLIPPFSTGAMQKLALGPIIRLKGAKRRLLFPE